MSFCSMSEHGGNANYIGMFRLRFVTVDLIDETLQLGICNSYEFIVNINANFAWNILCLLWLCETLRLCVAFVR